MRKKWIAINFLLLAITALLGWELQKSIKKFDAENDLAKIKPASNAIKRNPQEKQMPASARNYNTMEFSIIPEKNIFSESRSNDSALESAISSEPSMLNPKPILVGVIITDTQRSASIIDPASQERIRQAQTRKIGDVYRGYTIKEILPDQIVLEGGTRREIIPLHEGSKRTQGGKTSILSTRIIPIGKGSISGVAPVSIGSGAVAGIRPAGATGNPPSTQPINILPGTSQIRPVPSDQQPPASTRPAQPLQQNSPSGTDSQGRRIFKTPFGDILRPNR
jgi:hypothetical protein